MADILNIAGRVHSISEEEVVTTTDEILDDSQNKKQSEINTDVVANSDDVANLKNRMRAVEALGEISVGGGDVQIANTAADIEAGSGKVPTVNAIDGALQGIGFFECTTVAGTAAKTISATGYALRSGGSIKVKMTYKNTAASSVTLNINSTGAKALLYKGKPVDSGNTWEAGEVVEIYYDPTYNNNAGGYFANNVAGGSGDGVFDISVYNSGQRYTDLTAALGVNAAHVPTNVRAGGISVKYLGTDDKYHQYRYTLDYEDTQAGIEDFAEAGNWVSMEDELALAGVYDVSAHNGGAYFADLSALLSDANLSTLIPASVRRGGMSIKFIQGTEQSSDNKYVQYRLMSDSFTTDITKWAICEQNIEVQNPEFVYARIDKNKRVLYGVTADGNFYFGKGCPIQIKNYIQKKINELSLDEYEKIVTFLDGLEEGDTTLRTMLINIGTEIGNEITRATEAESNKVDKVPGKSLIDETFASMQSSNENPEYLFVEIDLKSRILGGRRKDGKRVENMPLVLPACEIKYNKNPEWVSVCLDRKGRILGGFKADGSFEYFKGVPAPIADFVKKWEPTKKIVCTGDSVTEGSHLDDAGSSNYGSPSYPAQLNTMLKDAGYDRYAVINQGNGGEELPDMVMRTCGMMNFLTQNITLSNSEDHWDDWVDIGSYWARNTDNRKIAIPYKDLNDVDYKVCLLHAYGETSPVFIDGNYYNFRTRGSSVTGEEGLTYDEIQKVSRDNKVTLIPAGTSIITGTSKAPFISIIMGGHNRADYLNFEKWAEMSESCLKTGNIGLVIGYHKPIWNVWTDLAGNNTTDEGRAERYADYHRKSIERFGVNFIDLWDEFYRHAMDYCIDVGFFSNLSAARIAEMREDLANHILPVEFSYDGAHQGDVHLSKEGYYVIAKLIFDKLVALKYILK